MATPTTRRRAARPARWRAAPPAQPRGHQTMERFAEAAEALLRATSFEEITVQDIVRRAGRPVGSFYARFGSKEAMLPFLYQRYHDRLEALFHDRLGRMDWASRDFEATVRAIVDFFVRAYEERKGLVRALTLFARRHPEALPADLLPQRRRIYAMPIAILARHRARIAHPDPEAAIGFGIYFVSSAARERVLFGDMPLARITPVSRRALRTELARALSSYLTREAPR